jgi:hypothetical protein
MAIISLLANHELALPLSWYLFDIIHGLWTNLSSRTISQRTASFSQYRSTSRNNLGSRIDSPCVQRLYSLWIASCVSISSRSIKTTVSTLPHQWTIQTTKFLSATSSSSDLLNADMSTVRSGRNAWFPGPHDTPPLIAFRDSAAPYRRTLLTVSLFFEKFELEDFLAHQVSLANTGQAYLSTSNR